ncbi:MAG TPA: PadR family transcriptional regulator [Bauldia sp.]|nr:PadR family transcriptional regulator [Bauldia sp.]
MSERPVSNPLALAVLACLAERPMHPYEMASTMRERRKDDAIKLNYGSLYSVIESLCKHGFIVAKETIKDGKRPERTVFELTENGRLELGDWLSELLSEPTKEYTHFEAGLSLMPVLSPEEALKLLRRRVEMLELELAKARSVDAYARERRIPRLHMVEREFQVSQREAEVSFVRALIDDLAGGRLDGLEEWRSWHTAG